MASVTDLAARVEEIRAAIKEIDTEHAGVAFSEDAKAKWNDLNLELEETEATIKELGDRKARLEELAADPTRSESEEKFRTSRGNRKVSRVPDDPTQLEEYRNRSMNMDDLDQAYRDGAMQILENATFSHPDAKREEQQDHVSRLLDTVDTRRSEMGTRSLARRIIMTESPGYKREFARYLATGQAGPEMQRAASLSGASGGYAVPVVLDPTVILTSSGQVNPLRQLARVEQIVGNVWEGVSSTGVSAAYSAEAIEASDNSPTLVQPTANVEKAQAFIPFSIEIGEDWGSFQSEMARLIQDAKDALESSKFLTGAGHGSNVPEGLHVGATSVVSSAATATFAVADLYTLENALAPRWKPRASIIANRAQFNKIRQFDTAGGASLWVQLQDGQPERLIGYPKYEYSAMTSGSTSSAWIATIGDFSQFLIVDRIGLNVELVPHLFGTANNYPNGQRGLYAYWRNTSKVLTPGLSANSAFQTLKLL